MDIFYSIVGFFSRGGVFMLPILFAAALGIVAKDAHVQPTADDVVLATAREGFKD